MKSMSCPLWACLSLFVATLSSMISCLILTSGLAMSTSTSGLLIWLTSPSPVTSGRYLKMQTNVHCSKTPCNFSRHQLLHPLTTAPSLAHQLHLRPLYSPRTHLPRVCPFQQRSSLMRSADAFSSLQMVCGRDSQKPRMGLSRSFSSVTYMEVEKKKKKIRYDSDLLSKYPCLLQLAAKSTLMVQCWRWLKLREDMTQFLGQLLTFFHLFYK